MLAIILVTLLAAVTSFLCSLMEASLYSISKAKIERLRQAGHKSGERLHQLRQHVQDPISAILTLNTIANTVGATVAGALVAHHYNNTVVGVFSGLFTLIILFGSEIIPKTLGVNYASKVAPMLSLPMVAIINVLYPFVWTCRFITHKFHRESHGPKEEDILALTQLGAETGTLHESEAQWAINALKLNDVTAADLVTPRTVVYMLPADMTLHEVKSRSAEWLFSKAPVTEGSGGDKVIGVLDRREVFDWMLHQDEQTLHRTTLRRFAHKPTFVPETIRCNALLRHFLESREHLIIAINEYGGMEGVVTLEDVLEYILGEEIVDRYDPHRDMQELARKYAQELLHDNTSGDPGSRPENRNESLSTGKPDAEL